MDSIGVHQVDSYRRMGMGSRIKIGEFQLFLIFHFLIHLKQEWQMWILGSGYIRY